MIRLKASALPNPTSSPALIRNITTAMQSAAAVSAGHPASTR
jgi:hypothetical protein